VVAGVVLHGKSLLQYARLEAESVDVLLDGVPGPIAEELMDAAPGVPSDALLAWQQSRIESLAQSPLASPTPGTRVVELWNSIEHLMVSGGDTRIAISRQRGFNRYGTTPRPRPEAVHFSSSTASSVSDYGFTYCDLLREWTLLLFCSPLSSSASLFVGRDLLAAMLRDGLSLQKLRQHFVCALSAELLDLFGLSDADADVTQAPSGTDTELLAVMVSIAPGGGLTNILISPEESGRGVKEAGAGRYFDLQASTGQRVRKGDLVWAQAVIRTVEIPIRDSRTVPRPQADVAAELRREIDAARARKERVLLHMLPSSKSGLSYPTEQVVAELVALAPAEIDVVVDACQMRNPFAQIGEWVRRGWMVQVSGSK
jgi:hypothetical protein